MAGALDMLENVVKASNPNEHSRDCYYVDLVCLDGLKFTLEKRAFDLSACSCGLRAAMLKGPAHFWAIRAAIYVERNLPWPPPSGTSVKASARFFLEDLPLFVQHQAADLHIVIEMDLKTHRVGMSWTGGTNVECMGVTSSLQRLADAARFGTGFSNWLGANPRPSADV